MNKLDELSRLKELMDTGGLTPEEYEMMKRHVLGSGQSQPYAPSSSDAQDPLPQFTNASSPQELPQSYQDSMTEPVSPAEKAEKASRLICILGMSGGLGFVAFGFIKYVENISKVEPASFGADFYSYIYTAAAAAANNALNLISIPIAIGWFMFFYFALKMFELKKQQLASSKVDL